MGDGGVSDGVAVGLSAVVHEVEVCDGRQPAEPVLKAGKLEPGSEEARGLGPLAGGDDDEHETTLAHARANAGTGVDERTPSSVVGTLQLGHRVLIQSPHRERHSEREGVPRLGRDRTRSPR